MWNHGENETDGKITCKIMNEVTSPFLPISVNGMKALVKQDKKIQKISQVRVELNYLQN